MTKEPKMSSKILNFSTRLQELDELNLKWYAIPSVGGMLLEIGGLQFPAVPFNGWYNSIEIVRDFLEEPKYGLLEVRNMKSLKYVSI